MQELKALNPGLLEGEDMHIGKFLESLQWGGQQEVNPAFKDSINSKLCAFANMAGVSAFECDPYYCTPTGHALVISWDLVRYLQEKWNLRLDFAHAYTGAVPYNVYRYRNSPIRSIAGWEDKYAPSMYDFLAALYGHKAPAHPKHSHINPTEVQGNRILPHMTYEQRRIFARPDVYVEIDRDDTSPEALYARAAWFEEHKVVPYTDKGVTHQFPHLGEISRSFEEQDLYNLSKYWLGVVSSGLAHGHPSFRFILAPAESFSCEATLQDRFLDQEWKVREYLTGEWKFRRLEQKLHKRGGKKARSIERVADSKVIKRKPAKDPVLLQLTCSGFAVLAAWKNETDEIYNLGERLRLI